MGKIQGVDVKIISKEAVKPSTLRASHRKDFIMSYVDQILPLCPPFLSTGLLFYTTPPETHPLDIRRLKASLSEILNTFYPLAGRVKQSTITCNDEGVPFFETKVNYPLSLVLSWIHRKLDLGTKFLPPREALGIVGGAEQVVHLAIQVNVFSCGGVAIGWYDIHKIMDGTSSATFFKNWAALASQQFDDPGVGGLVHPDFDAAITAFPPLPNPGLLQLVNGYNNQVQGSSIVVKSFVFRSNDICNLKARASSIQVPNPTRYQALAGFIWEQLKSVTQKRQQQNDDEDTDTILQVTIDMRPFTTPPLPKGAIGNLVSTAVVRSEKKAKLPDLVVEIQTAVSRMKNEIRNYHGEKGVRKVRASWDNLIGTLADYKERAYKVVSWCNLGYNDLDFGFGKPKWMIPTDGTMSPFHRNLVILNDFVHSDGDGIEAWFFLEEKDMKFFESNPEFLSFSSPL